MALVLSLLSDRRPRRRKGGEANGEVSEIHTKKAWTEDRTRAETQAVEAQAE